MKQEIDPFYLAYRGAFTGLLKWPDLDALWQEVTGRAEQAWYIYTTSEAPPATPATEQELRDFIRHIDKRLRTDHAEDYCGIVYADSKTNPTYIKIYDPNNLGVVCGISREPIFPGWILSQLPPKPLEGLPPLAEKPPSWWRRILPGWNR